MKTMDKNERVYKAIWKLPISESKKQLLVEKRIEKNDEFAVWHHTRFNAEDEEERRDLAWRISQKRDKILKRKEEIFNGIDKALSIALPSEAIVGAVCTITGFCQAITKGSLNDVTFVGGGFLAGAAISAAAFAVLPSIEKRVDKKVARKEDLLYKLSDEDALQTHNHKKQLKRNGKALRKEELNGLEA